MALPGERVDDVEARSPFYAIRLWSGPDGRLDGPRTIADEVVSLRCCSGVAPNRGRHTTFPEKRIPNTEGQYQSPIVISDYCS